MSNSRVPVKCSVPFDIRNLIVVHLHSGVVVLRIKSKDTGAIRLLTTVRLIHNFSAISTLSEPRNCAISQTAIGRSLLSVLSPRITTDKSRIKVLEIKRIDILHSYASTVNPVH